MVAFCTKEIDLDKKSIDFTFSDGSTRTLDVDALPEEIKTRLMLHGASQKGGDSFAGAKGDTKEALASLDKVIETLVSGSWTASRGDGETKPRTTELAQALAQLKGVTLEVAQAAVEAADEDKRKAWRGHPKIKAVIASLRAAKAEAKAARSEEAAIEF
jgi:hypothetical protein